MNAVPVSPTAIYIQDLQSKVQFLEGGWDSAKIYESGKENGSLKRRVAESEAEFLPKPDLAGAYWNDEMDLLFTVWR